MTETIVNFYVISPRQRYYAEIHESLNDPTDRVDTLKQKNTTDTERQSYRLSRHNIRWIIRYCAMIHERLRSTHFSLKNVEITVLEKHKNAGHNRASKSAKLPVYWNPPSNNRW